MTRVLLSGWGAYPRIESDLRRVERPDFVSASLDSNGTIARGLGRSYGDAAVGGRVLDLTRLDRVLSWDDETGTLTCEAGMSLERIIEVFTPRGFFPMITPGTKFVTVGGCIANDIHGKAHHVDGCFSSCVERFELLLATGEVITCDRTRNADVFWATFGGLGLTGIVLTATLRLRKIESAYYRAETVVVPNLDALLQAFDEGDSRYTHSLAWIDSLAKGPNLGRGVLTVGNWAKLEELPKKLARDPLRIAQPTPLVVPFELPNFALNPLTLRVLNALIEQVQAHGAGFVHYDKFVYPLDAIAREWNRGYGSRGFTQYQFVVPAEDGARRMRPILERIASSGYLPFLNVLKKFGPENEAHLSFPFEGYTFAIDFPITAGLDRLIAELDRMVIDAGGRIYLGKDAFVSPSSLEQMYPRLSEWRTIKDRLDPNHVFRSHLSERVGLTRSRQARAA